MATSRILNPRLRNRNSIFLLSAVLGIGLAGSGLVQMAETGAPSGFAPVGHTLGAMHSDDILTGNTCNGSKDYDCVDGQTSIFGDDDCTMNADYGCGTRGGLGALSVFGDASCTTTGSWNCGWVSYGAVSVAGNATCSGSESPTCGFFGVGAASVAGEATCTDSATNGCGQSGVGAVSVLGDARCENHCGSWDENGGFGAVSVLGHAYCDREFGTDHTTDAQCIGGADLLRLEIPANAIGPEGVPAEGTPNVPATPITTPAIGTPATCAVAICTSPTSVLPSEPVSVPGTPTIGTPASKDVCDQEPVLCNSSGAVCVPTDIVCIGPFGSVVILPAMPGSTKHTPPVAVPPICGVEPSACLEPMTLVPSSTQVIPGHGPVEIFPGISVAVEWTDISASGEPNTDAMGFAPPITVTIPVINAPVTVCGENSCPLPTPPGAHGSGTLTATIIVDGTTYEEPVPVNF